MKVGDREDFWMQIKDISAGQFRVEATRYKVGHWGVRVYQQTGVKLPRNPEGDVWGKPYKDEDLPDATDGDAVIERAWEECCQDPGMEWNKKSR